ncbi:hypothetical protein CROQUDRAFT_673653 [Cronartium quercuum f. sp. fusiforme G11]|uniref:Uncharacterized protein n=1 Tax=Cronartium quercuum f. sp. fusiforme G11 TaxID=708437 RepID=A0A9P6NDW0_9BASI|nr:hypothetical protein CROQUDRAFT_673653 [Cronartium quercuum f. sp. fusiforme G11]
MSDYLYPSLNPAQITSSSFNHHNHNHNHNHNQNQSNSTSTPEPPSIPSIHNQFYNPFHTDPHSSFNHPLGSPRKNPSHLSHSRSYPNLIHPHPSSAQPSTTSILSSSFRSRSMALEIPQPNPQFTSYSFESNLFNHAQEHDQQINPSNLFHSHHRSGTQHSGCRLRTGSDASIQSSLAGYPDHPSGYPDQFRPRSGSESSSSWQNLQTPMTPADIAFQNHSYSAGFKSDFYPSTQHDFHSHHNPHHQKQQHQHSLSVSISESDHDQADGSNPAQEIYDLSAQPETLDHFNNSQSPFEHLTLPQHDPSSRRMSKEPSDDGSIPSNPHPSPLTLDIASSQPKVYGASINHHHLQPPMSARPSYSRSVSIDSSFTRARSSSLAIGHSSDEGQLVQNFNPAWSQTSSQPISAQIGPQFAGLNLDSQNNYLNMPGTGYEPGFSVSTNAGEMGAYDQQANHQYQMIANVKQSIPRATREALLAPHIKMYLSSSNRFLLGERTVLVLSGKVAQKSYGAEKRFLCPPPSALLLGCSWWSAAEADPRRPIGNHRIALVPPTTIISMSGEHSMPTEAYSEWMSISGHVVGDQAALDDVVIAGRCVGKQLHISEVDEKTKRVEALVKVIAPGFGPPESRQIGTFPSRPIKVISKPSKKRQSIKNLDLCIHHGTTIALFNRLRSQTVSTKYLCVSGPSASFPAGDWRAMSGMEEKPFAPAEDATCFVARTSAWDPFIVYLVDPSKPSATAHPSGAEQSHPTGAPPPPGYPRAPFNALPVSPGSGPVPIYYNQPIVLQCLSTAVVSPVMVIRKVDKGSTATGGASLDGSGSMAGMSRDVPVAPGEMIGDPVSQLHKIALEVMTDPEGAYAAAQHAGSSQAAALAGFPGSGSFLACLGENVGVHRAESGRVPIASPSSLVSPPSSASSFGMASSSQDALAEAAYMANQLTQPLLSANSAGSGRARSAGPSGHATMGDPNSIEFGSSDGGKVKRTRRVSASQSSSNGIGRLSTPGKGRRRAGSITSNGTYDDFASESSDGMHHYHYHSQHHHSNAHGGYHPAPPPPPTASAKVWTIDCGEPAVWTIVGCDVERHTFWVPPVLFNSKPSSAAGTQGAVSEVFRTPIPYFPIGTESPTPIPVVHKYLMANPVSVVKSGRGEQDLRMITIYGANFSRELHVWFGDVPSEVVEFKCAEVIVALPPNQIGEIGSDGNSNSNGSNGNGNSNNNGMKRSQIVLVREDGIVFPSKLFKSFWIMMALLIELFFYHYAEELVA